VIQKCMMGILSFCWGASFDLLAGQETTWQVTPKFKINYPALQEVSGISRSQRFEDVFWVHNDSGDEARVFAINRQGDVIYPEFLPFHGQQSRPGRRPWPGHAIELAAHYDWEDIASDADWLYIADTGNNGNARRDLGIYKVPQFNPRVIEKTRAMRYLPVAYPDQQLFPAENWHYDSEALFVDAGQLYLITKHRVAGRIGTFEPGGNLYRLTDAESDRPNELKQVDSLSTLFMVTGAALSPNGERLAVLGFRDLWLFPRPNSGDAWLSEPHQTLDLTPYFMGQVEAITWLDDQRLWVVNEAGAVFEVSLGAAVGKKEASLP
jgi:hypothetical protein